MMFKNIFMISACFLIIFFVFVDNQAEGRCCCPRRRKPKCPAQTAEISSPASTSSLSAAPLVSTSSPAIPLVSSSPIAFSSSAVPTTRSSSAALQNKTVTIPVAATTKLSIRGNCTPADCHCDQCKCEQSTYYSTLFVPDRKDPSVANIFFTGPQLQNDVNFCPTPCMLSEDGIFYKPQNDFYQTLISFYCDNPTDPTSCAFYAFLRPNGDRNSQNLTLVSDDGAHVFHNGANTEPMGRNSSYLKIVGASCAGCCDLSAMFVVPSCFPPGTFNTL